MGYWDWARGTLLSFDCAEMSEVEIQLPRGRKACGIATLRAQPLQELYWHWERDKEECVQ